MIQCLRKLGLALVLLLWTAGVSAQETDTVPVIGVLRAASATQHDPAMEAMRAELRAMGYTEGRNIRIEQRFANRRAERLPQLANELVRMKVKVIVAVNEASLWAAKQATSTIPRAAYFIDRLLHGAVPGDLPVEEATRFKLTINLKTAKALGLTIPQPLPLRADEVIR